MLVQGARIGFFQGDIRFLTDDLNTLKPTVFPVVPRLLNRMYDKVGGPTLTMLYLNTDGSVLYNYGEPLCVLL